MNDAQAEAIIRAYADDRRLHLAAVSQPAAGADWTYTVGTRSKIVGVMGTLSTSATVINRFPRIEYADASGNKFMGAGLNSAVTASLVMPINWFIGAQLIAQTWERQMPMPEWWLEPGWTVKSRTTQIDTTDQWSKVFIAYYLERERVGERGL